jgi:O-antigen ligase
MAAATRTLYDERGLGLGLGVALLLVFGVACGAGIAFGELEATLGALAAAACLAALIDYRVGATLLMVLLPISSLWIFPRSMFGYTGLNPLNVLLGATLLSFLVRGSVRGFMPKPLLWLYIVPIVFAGLLGSRHALDIHPFFYENLLIHYNDAAGYLRDALLHPLVMVAIALMVGAAVARSQKPERYILGIILSAWVASLVTIIFVASAGVRLGALSTTGSREFLSALGMHANDLGRLYAVAYALLLFTWGEAREKALRSLLVLTMGIVTVALVLTFSRGAFVGFVLINILFLLWKFNAKTLAIAIGVLAIGAMFLPGFIMSRVTLGFGDGGDVNTVSAGRIDEIWLPLIPDLLRTPPWGNGLDSVMWSEAMWSGAMLMVNHPHSAYIQALLDMGILGLALLLAYFWHVWKGLLALGSNAYLSPALRGLFQGAVAALLCFLITGFAGSSLRPVQEFAFLWLAIGMMYGIRARAPASIARPTGETKPLGDARPAA